MSTGRFVARVEVRLLSTVHAYLVRSTREAIVVVNGETVGRTLDELTWHRRAREPGWEIIDAWPPPTRPSRS